MQRREVPVNTTGELAVRGPGVMMRYYKNPEATREVLTEDGWLYTGDMVVKKDDGQLYIVDRKKDVIISGGENIYPVPIEDFIHNFLCFDRFFIAENSI
jgi:long-chain acyl-CoA synthetase